MHHAILREEEDAATEFPSILKLLIKKIRIAGNNPLTRQWWYDVMTSRPPPLPKNIEKCREEILDRVEEGWQEEDWTTTMPQLISELLQKNFTFTRNLNPTRAPHAAEGVQWIRMEELGKALTNRCRAVRELPNKKQKNLVGTRDRTTNSEQLEFECQLKTPTRGRIHELLNLGASSSQNLFQSLITNQDLTGILYLARRSKYHLSIWPLSRGELIPSLDEFIFFLVSQFLLQVLSRSVAPLPPSLDFSSFFPHPGRGIFPSWPGFTTHACFLKRCAQCC